MFQTFLIHSAKRLFRSPSAGKDVAVHLTVILFVCILIVYAFVFGIFLEQVIVDGLDHADPVGFLNQAMLYYFAAEFVLRYLFQNLPAWDVQPYLHLPIKRACIVHLLLCRSLFHFFNVLVFPLFAPFAFTVMMSSFGMLQAITWLLSIWLISINFHFAVVTLKHFADNAWTLVIFIATAAAFTVFNYAASVISFGDFQKEYTYVVVLALMILMLYLIAYKHTLARMYQGESKITTHTFQSVDLKFLQRLGLIGAWINIELKLIFRNKRSREVLFLHLAFHAVTLIIWYKKQDSAIAFHFLFALFSSACFTGNYGQYLFGWQAAHFDFTLTQPTSIRFFVESKFWLLTFVSLIWLVCSIPFAWYGWEFLLVIFASALFNIGVGTFIVMNMSMWGARKLDLTHRGSLNYEGAGVAQWLMGVPVFITPSLLFFPFSVAGYPTVGLVLVAIFGLCGLMFHKKLIDVTLRRLLNMRYTMAANFKRD